MKILKISQLQIQGLEEPVKNAELIKENLLKTIQINLSFFTYLIMLLMVQYRHQKNMLIGFLKSATR